MNSKNTVYDTERSLKQEKMRLLNESFGTEAKSMIIKFGEYTMSRGVSDHRLYFLMTRLRMIARILKGRFLSPSNLDIESLLLEFRKKGYTVSTVEDYRSTTKLFYKWLLEKDEEYPPCVKWIKNSRSLSQKTKPEAPISKRELSSLTGTCINNRDKAIIQLLYDSGCRISELLTATIEELQFDDYGAILIVTGKTGPRRVRVVGDSVPYLRSWLEVHPFQSDRGAYLFVGLERDIRGQPMNYHQCSMMLKKAAMRANIKRRIHPHLFRHTRATLLASRVAEAPLEGQLGWSRVGRSGL